MEEIIANTKITVEKLDDKYVVVARYDDGKKQGVAYRDLKNTSLGSVEAAIMNMGLYRVYTENGFTYHI